MNRRSAESLIMGVVNITPDSFSDGGDFLDPGRAVARIEQLFDEGADIVDLGAESSRPGAQAVDLEEEWRRLKPILERLSQIPLPTRAWISLDTYKADVMVRALDYRVQIINDIKGEADAKTLQLIANKGLTYLAMHMHRDPQAMQITPLDGPEALRAVDAFYRQTHARLKSFGFCDERIWLDPGIGFGKTDRANLWLFKQALQLVPHYEIVLGISRKSFMGRILEIDDPRDRDPASKMLELSGLFAGVRAIRTHDVRRLKKLLNLLQDCP